MINLSNATKLMTDLEVLNLYAQHFKKIYEPESYTDVINSMTKDFENPFKTLSIITGHDIDFIIGYIRAQIIRKVNP